MKTGHQASRERGRVPAAQPLQRSKASAAAQRRVTRAEQPVAQAAVAAAEQPVQRVRAKPGDEELKAAVAKFVGDTKGSCCVMSAEVHKVLVKNYVDSPEEAGAVLMTWAEREGTPDADSNNHTAATATWTSGKYVIDTTSGQFGGEDVYIGKVEDWREYILGLQKTKISHVKIESQSKPYTDGEMQERLFDLRGKVAPMERPKITKKQKKNLKRLNRENDERKKAEEGGAQESSCYLTTACVQHRGLGDDCRELTVLRAFRDGYLSAQPHGPALIGEYYRHAPRLVRAISDSPNANRTWEWIYRVIRGCVRDISRGRPERAEAAYRGMVATLSAEFPARRAKARVRRS